LLQNTVTVAISFIVRVFKQLSFIMQLLDKKMRVFKLTDSQMELLLDSIEYASQNENLPFWEQSKIDDFDAMKADVFEGYR